MYTESGDTLKGSFSEGRKEYRIILQKLKLPEVSPPILVKKEKGRKMVLKFDVGEKDMWKKEKYCAHLQGSIEMFHKIRLE